MFTPESTNNYSNVTFNYINHCVFAIQDYMLFMLGVQTLHAVEKCTNNYPKRLLIHDFKR